MEAVLDNGTERVPNGVHGAQAIGRACLILREIARFGSAGARVRDLTAASALSHATVHRILQSLVAEAFLIQDERTRRYKLGTAIFELGLAAPSPLDHLVELRPMLQDLAERIGDTAYLMMRRGDEVICLAHAEGASPIRAYVIEVGEIRPITASLAGICMLAESPDDEVEKVISRTAQATSRFGDSTPTYVRRQVADARAHGYCLSREVLLKTATGISATVPNANGPSFLGISLSAVTSRVPDRRVKDLVRELLKTCAEVGRVVQQ